MLSSDRRMKTAFIVHKSVEKLPRQICLLHLFPRRRIATPLGRTIRVNIAPRMLCRWSCVQEMPLD